MSRYKTEIMKFKEDEKSRENLKNKIKDLKYE